MGGAVKRKAAQFVAVQAGHRLGHHLKDFSIPSRPAGDLRQDPLQFAGLVPGMRAGGVERQAEQVGIERLLDAALQFQRVADLQRQVGIGRRPQ